MLCQLEKFHKHAMIFNMMYVIYHFAKGSFRNPTKNVINFQEVNQATQVLVIFLAVNISFTHSKSKDDILARNH